MKHKLKLEDLAVDTFSTTAELRHERGTVRAFDASRPFVCGPTVFEDTCPQDCYPSLELSCAGSCDTCPITRSIDCA